MKTAARTEAEALVAEIGELAEAIDAYGEPSEQDLLDLDEKLTDLRDHAECDAKTATWCEKMLRGIGDRLDRGDHD